ncbi:MAG TPA: APC family permease [Rugosimonospora sp.]|nr:APC family permease [Rugosimonospora sp.]
MSTTSLARNRLGVFAVLFFVLSGVGPLMATAGVITTAYAVTGLTSIPIAFVAVALLLGLFSVGYVAMARHITNAGAFYAFITRGLGRTPGIAAAIVALVAYNLLQVGLYGAFGPGAASYAADKFGVHLAWWVWALGAWLVVTVLGVRRVDLNGRVLAVLLTCEVAVVVAITVAGLLHPHAGRVSFATLYPSRLFVAGVGAALVIAVLAFVGFEGAVVFGEEARHPRRTIPLATYTSLGLIMLVYAAASWAMAVHFGDTQVVGAARQLGPETLFDMAPGRLADAGRTLYLTSLFAALLAFHAFVARYLFALAREGVLPPALRHTTASGAPRVASLTQSAVGLLVIILYAAAGWDPMTKLFFWLGTTGGFGVLVLITATSGAVLGFFGRHTSGEPLWHRLIAPGLSLVLLLGVLYLVVRNYSTLLGVPPGHPAAWWFPLGYALAIAFGLLWAVLLRAVSPQSYQRVGA